MLSYGAINGSEMNSLTIDGGTFVLEASAVASAQAVGTAIAVRRARVVDMISVAGISEAVVVVRRAMLSANRAIVFNVGAVAYRRATFTASSVAAAASVIATGVRRCVAPGASSFSVSGAAALFWKYRQRAPAERVAQLNDEMRVLNIAPQIRRHVVSAPPTPFNVPEVDQ